MSASEAMPVEAMKAQTLTSCETLPSQPNLVASNWVPSPWPSSGSAIDARRENADSGAVLRRDVVEIIDQLERARARHVLRHDLRIAGNMAAEIARQRAAIEVVAAAGGKADQHVDGFAGIEIIFGGRRTTRQTSRAMRNSAMTVANMERRMLTMPSPPPLPRCR